MRSALRVISVMENSTTFNQLCPSFVHGLRDGETLSACVAVPRDEERFARHLRDGELLILVMRILLN